MADVRSLFKSQCWQVILVVLLNVVVSATNSTSIGNGEIQVNVDPRDGSFSLLISSTGKSVFRAQIGAEVDHHWLMSTQYPSHRIEKKDFSDKLGAGQEITVTHGKLPGRPDLVCTLRVYANQPFGAVEVEVVNSTGQRLQVQAIRTLDELGSSLHVDGPLRATRILSDSFSEDRPDMKILDLGRTPDGTHRGVGSQLIYNTQSKQSFFLGTSTSRRFLTIIDLHTAKSDSDGVQESHLTVTSSGTTEIQRGESLKDAPIEDRIELSLPLAPGETINSEQLMFTAGHDYHTQLQAYGNAIRSLYHPRVGAETPIGWWSWTVFYFGVNEGAALTNAQWMASHLKQNGYTYFHLDEGYDYARGEYLTPDAVLFPHGMQVLGDKISRLGLKLGVWTAPFEVSERAWVYQHHKDWLVHNAKGVPIPIGHIFEKLDQLYVLDVTNPGAQEYLRQTYLKLVNEWGVRYIKLDFMDDSAIEGYYYRPNTTALEAQRIGLKIIRDAVGEGVLLDKDGSPMLNAVGYVDTGRISVDTGHSFAASKNAASGIAARYYMNRNFFVSDPDAYSVSEQPVIDPDWHERVKPLTLDEARVAITLAALSGGMFELGDDLPTLGLDQTRFNLVRNPELLTMVRLGQAATPLDLMSYRAQDEQPSLFLLREDKRQAILAIFNWTEQSTSHSIDLSELNLEANGQFHAFDVLDNNAPVPIDQSIIVTNVRPHSVRLIKIVNALIPAAAPAIVASIPDAGSVGTPLSFFARTAPESVPAVLYHWDFGDGTRSDTSSGVHTYTHGGNYMVVLEAEGVDGLTANQSFKVNVSGETDTHFRPERNRRFEQSETPLY